MKYRPFLSLLTLICLVCLGLALAGLAWVKPFGALFWVLAVIALQTLVGVVVSVRALAR